MREVLPGRDKARKDVGGRPSSIYVIILTFIKKT